MIASNSASSSPNEVSMRQQTSGILDRISRHTLTPSPSGRRTSSTATSGCSAGMRARADSAVPASPATVMSPSASSRSRTPLRTISWSSRRNTLIMSASVRALWRAGQGPWSRTGGHRSPRGSCGGGTRAGGATGADVGELLLHPAMHVVAADAAGHGGQGGAAGARLEPERVLDPVGQPLDVERVARDRLTQLRGGPGELGQDQRATPPAGVLDGDVLL